MKIKGMLFILFAAFVGHIGAMDSDRETAKDQLQKLIEEKLPAELHLLTLEIKIGQLLEAPFPEKVNPKFAINYLSLITPFSQGYKKIYLNKFAKHWYLKYGKELKLSDWIKKHFPGQTPEQVLDYGFSINDYLNSPVLINKIQITTRWGETQLNLSNMKINNLHGLQKIPNIDTVQILHLNNNQQLTIIQSKAFAGLTNLQTLYLVHNQQLSTILTDAFAGLTNLEVLYLENNQLSTIQSNAFADLTNLQTLYLNNNQLSTIQSNAFADLTNLQRLHLENNQLSTIQSKAFAGLTNLQTLYLENNQLSTIQPDAFAGLTNLEVLYLENNQLSTILTDAFAGLPSLTNLDLDHNQLSTIQPNAFAGLPNLRWLYLNYNQLDKKTKEGLKKALPNVRIRFK